MLYLADIPGRPTFFLKRDGGGVDLKEKRVGEAGGVKGAETEARMY